MCTLFRLTRTNLFTKDEPLELDLALTQVLAVPGHWSQDAFVPPDLVLWAVRSHQPGDFATVFSKTYAGAATATYRYTLTALSS